MYHERSFIYCHIPPLRHFDCCLSAAENVFKCSNTPTYDVLNRAVRKQITKNNTAFSRGRSRIAPDYYGRTFSEFLVCTAGVVPQALSALIH